MRVGSQLAAMSTGMDLGRRRTLDLNFKIAAVALILNFYVNSLFVVFQKHSIGGISIAGFYRMAALGVVGLILIGNSRNYFPVWMRHKRFILVLFAFQGLMLLQIPLVDNPRLHLQGAVKFFFYTSILIVAIEGCYFHAKDVISFLNKAFILLFFSVAIFYPYIIYKSGMSPFERFFNPSRLSFLLGAGNEDAHFMMTLMPFTLAAIFKRKVITGIFLVLFALALFYNGTRTTLMMFIIIVALFYFLMSRNRYFLLLIAALILWWATPYLVLFFRALFAGEMNLFVNFQRFLRGEYIGGNLSGRLTYIWLPAVTHTLQHSPWIGFGNNGWLELGRSNIQLLHPYWGITLPSPHNFFVWSFVNWGFAGLAMIVYLYAQGIAGSWRSMGAFIHRQRSSQAVALFCSWLSFFSWSLIANVNGTHGWTVFIVLLILTLAQKRMVKERRETEPLEAEAAAPAAMPPNGGGAK